MLVSVSILEKADDFDKFLLLCQMERRLRRRRVDASLSDEWSVILEDLTCEIACEQIVKIAASDERCQELTHGEIREFVDREAKRTSNPTISFWDVAKACLHVTAIKVFSSAPYVDVLHLATA